MTYSKIPTLVLQSWCVWKPINVCDTFYYMNYAFHYSISILVTHNANLRCDHLFYVQISAGIECTIVCARLLMPNRLATPKITGVGGYNITIEFATEWFPYTFYFSLGLTGKNTTEKDFLEWIGERKPGFWWCFCQ